MSKIQRKIVFVAEDNTNHNSEVECKLHNAEMEFIGLIQSQMAAPGSITSQFTSVNSVTAPTIAGKSILRNPEKGRDLLNRIIRLRAVIDGKGEKKNKPE